MTKTDKIWLVTALPLLALMLMIMLRVFSYDRSVAGSRRIQNDKYSIELEGGEFTAAWRNFYKIKKESPDKPLLIRVLSREDLIYAMVNFEIKGIDPAKAQLSGAAFSEINKSSNTIKFTIRAGSRKDMKLMIQEEAPRAR
ncbi:MAG: hypothetical protein COZ15_07040 [Elusimicrobia bacterium CG_4_10_14_3_um_filter_49_12_50_7]|nr:MAG: hypothetical protein COZ72_00045 [Elusimicrobia bacterium CG_4_8_14_3_um_filter_50_9]PIY15305.1 MAG: hypothetical protein COZ15_07040 [Elusimicrobia bacterium CG_4_10_14_3_um_filter_49_12_50_7]